MLQQLPIAATAEVWLRDALNSALTDGFTRICGGLGPQSWLIFVPAPRRAAMAKRGKLSEAIEAVFTAFTALQANERDVVRTALEDQQQLDMLFNGARVALPLDQLPAAIQAPLKNYASRVFELFDDSGIRERTYAIYDKQGYLACPFCGYEALDSSRLRQMDWDHYLARTLYPFAGADLRNFSPMGEGCNSSYKRSKDILRSNGGARRACFDPYMSPPAAMSLAQTQLFTRGYGNEMPLWQVNLVGDVDRCASWDSIFEVTARWSDRLDRIYDNCIAKFGAQYKGELFDDEAIVAGLIRLEAAEILPHPEPGGFLRRAVFALLAERAAQITAEGERLRRLLRVAIAPAVPAVA